MLQTISAHWNSALSSIFWRTCKFKIWRSGFGARTQTKSFIAENKEKSGQGRKHRYQWVEDYFRSAFLHRGDPNTKVVQVQYLNGKKVCLAVKCLVFKYHLYQYSDHHLNTRLVLKWHQNTSPNFRCSCYLNIGH